MVNCFFSPFGGRYKLPFGHSGQSIPGHCPPDPLPGSTRDFVCQAECERTGSIARIGDGTSDVWENGIG